MLGITPTMWLDLCIDGSYCSFQADDINKHYQLKPNRKYQGSLCGTTAYFVSICTTQKSFKTPK